MAGKAAEAKTEIEAKRATLQNWLAKARAIGPGYTRWELAWGRRIECTRTSEGNFSCQAIARPCMIKQVPNPDLPILKRGT